MCIRDRLQGVRAPRARFHVRRLYDDRRLQFGQGAAHTWIGIGPKIRQRPLCQHVAIATTTQLPGGKLRHGLAGFGGTLSVDVIEAPRCGEVIIKGGLPVPRACRGTAVGKGPLSGEPYALGWINEFGRDADLPRNLGRVARTDAYGVGVRKARVRKERYLAITIDGRRGGDACGVTDELRGQ